jgi:hypothetical protein
MISDSPKTRFVSQEEPIEVTVSITLSKTFTINIPNRYWEKEEDRHTCWITINDVKNSTHLPDEILDDVFKRKNIDAFEANCAGNWNVDEIEVIEE